jgi:hypothetical protein
MLRNLQVRAARFRRGNLVQPRLPIGDGLVRSIPPSHFDLLRRFLQELKSVAVDRDAPFVAFPRTVSDVVCSFWINFGAGQGWLELSKPWLSIKAKDALIIASYAI